MPNRLFYTVKLTSGLLKEYKYNLNISVFKKIKQFEPTCLESGLVISLADSQMLKSIRDITGQHVDLFQLEEWYHVRDKLKKKNKITPEERKLIQEMQNNIYDMMYIPEYVSVVMESKKEYERMFKKGFLFNGTLYKRFSCSASQARVSTVIFVKAEIKEELKTRLDAGRDLNHLLAPTKYSAYFGLYSSAIKAVSAPRFCIVRDYVEKQPVDVKYIIEKGENEDDIAEDRTLDIEFNRFDGSGLISPQFAEQWGKDLGVDYTPCQFCLRWAFTKGMVNEFDFVKFCKEKNNGNYFIKDIYGNMVDLREIDVILSEGQVKLWDSWKSQEHLRKCASENGIVWGITKYSPKEDKKSNTLNYQFLQTLRLNKDQIKEICEDTINYIKGVSYENIYYTLLFMLGEGMTEDNMKKYLKESDNYWLKTLLLNHNLLNDKYTKEKIRDNIVRQIEQSCLGKLWCKGNFQCICPDPYAYMEWITGQKVVGLLKAKEAFCEFWNKEGATVVDAMRSPLTHFSEHGIDHLQNTEEMKEWYKYCYSGYICNVHDEFTMIHAGSDFDYDIIFSTNNQQFLDGAYKNQRVVTYAVKKPKKRPFTEEDLFVADTFSFGTRIGQITNVASTICAMIPEFKEETPERILLEDRIAMCCAAQSREIDKTKIGQDVKGTPAFWKQWMKLLDSDTPEERIKKNFYNSIMCDKKPYFFKYKYKDLSSEYNKYIKTRDKICWNYFRKTLSEILSEDICNLSDKEKTFVEDYYKYLPVVDSECVMNQICHYIESVDFDIKEKIRNRDGFDCSLLMSRGEQTFDPAVYKRVLKAVEKMFKEYNNSKSAIDKNRGRITGAKDIDSKTLKENLVENIKSSLIKIEPDFSILTNYLIKIFYKDKISYNKSILWEICGRQIYSNVLQKSSSATIPVKNENGNISYLYENYSLVEVNLRAEREEDEN